MLHGKITTSFILMITLFLIAACSRAMLEEQSISTDKIILSLKVSPLRSTVEAGEQIQLTAIATFEDDSTVDVTSSVNWTALVPATATMDSNRGVVLGVSKGMGVVNANYNGISANALVSVTNAQLSSIEVSPMNQTIASGVGQNFIATGIYSDSTKSDLTNQVTWVSSSPSVAQISNDSGSKGHALGNQIGNVTISASYGSISGSTGLTVDSLSVLSISITPQAATIAKGSDLQLFATAHYSDGSTADITPTVSWASSSSGIATISNTPGSEGRATGIATGQATISATLDSVTAHTVINVSSAILNSLAISPSNGSGAIGIQEQFRVEGTYSDGSKQDLTGVAHWSSTDLTKLLVSDLPGLKGQAIGLLNGSVTVSATVTGLTATAPFNVTAAILSSISITPSSLSLPLGLDKPLKAIGTFSDATVKDITDEVVWSTLHPTIATISNATGSHGKILCKAVGATTAVASLGAVTASAAVNTTNAILSSINLSPANPSIPLGKVLKMTATGVFSDATTADITNLVRWTTGNSSVADPSNANGYQGFLYSLATGSASIVATLDSVSRSTIVSVIPKELVAITIAPAAGTIIPLGVRQLKATGLYTDGSSADITSLVTWTVNLPLGSINLGGLLLAITPGLLDVTATLGTISKTNAFNLVL